MNTIPTIEELEALQTSGSNYVEYPLPPWNEGGYAMKWCICEDQKLDPDDERSIMDLPKFTPNEVLEMFKKLQGKTVIRVFESSENGAHVIGRFTEPAYTTEEGIKKARWKWMDWLRGLHAGEKREYLDFYETK